jgi:hypothetical protein
MRFLFFGKYENQVVGTLMFQYVISSNASENVSGIRTLIGNQKLIKI